MSNFGSPRSLRTDQTPTDTGERLCIGPSLLHVPSNPRDTPRLQSDPGPSSSGTLSITDDGPSTTTLPATTALGSGLRMYMADGIMRGFYDGEKIYPLLTQVEFQRSYQQGIPTGQYPLPSAVYGYTGSLPSQATLPRRVPTPDIPLDPQPSLDASATQSPTTDRQSLSRSPVAPIVRTVQQLLNTPPIWENLGDDFVVPPCFLPRDQAGPALSADLINPHIEWTNLDLVRPPPKSDIWTGLIQQLRHILSLVAASMPLPLDQQLLLCVTLHTFAKIIYLGDLGRPADPQPPARRSSTAIPALRAILRQTEAFAQSPEREMVEDVVRAYLVKMAETRQ
jgi:hypothetical protein